MQKWSLDDLYPSLSQTDLQKHFEQINQQVVEFEALRESLSSGIPLKDFLSAIQKLEKIHDPLNRLYSYANLKFAEDTQDQGVQTLMAQMDQYAAELSNRVMFFTLWWKKLDDENAQRLMSESGDYHYWLEELRHFSQYTLSEEEEKIINLKDITGVSASNTLYDAITNRYRFNFEVDGEKKEFSRGELMVYAHHHNPSLRTWAYNELYRVYGDDGDILGQMYQTRVRDWNNEEVQLRGFATPMSARNLANDIPDEVVDLLLNTCQKNAGVFQQFFKLKAKLLQLGTLRRHDLYAPVVEADHTTSFEDATALVLKGFAAFDEEVADEAFKVFEQNHIDSEVRVGKRSGAFCLTAAPTLTPWVLINYQGKTSDVTTLAHELGHAVHSLLASDHSVFTQHPCLPLAETASTFGEMLIVDELLRINKDPDLIKDLLFQQVDDAYATIQRQAYFALFEKKAHEMTREGASVKDLCDAYLENLKEQFGDAMLVDDIFKWEWVSIPHIYQVPFYVYAYAFGQLLVLALYQQYKKEGADFIPKYKRILSAGGSVAPLTLLKNEGIDIADPAFWQGGFDVIQKMVNELDRMTAK
ncbi:MAG: M3 family oligoendopeptidase [Anaerolineaceae bacterium]|nr:M3 family oligoendopeptidase [Anaerolineaceae bacterium]